MTMEDLRLAKRWMAGFRAGILCAQGLIKAGDCTKCKILADLDMLVPKKEKKE